MTILLSMSSLAGTARTLVAVGTLRLAAMFCAVRAAAPRSLFTSASAGGGVAAAWLPRLTGAALAGAWAGSAAGASAAAWAVGAAAWSVGAEPAQVRTGCGPVPLIPRTGR